MGNMFDLSLHEYAEVGDLNAIRDYVTKGGDIDRRDFFGNTALHRACCMGYLNVATFLMENGSDINAVAKDGWTPLHLACRWGRVEITKLLVAKGADVNALTRDGRTPGELLKVELSARDRRDVIAILGYKPSGGGSVRSSSRSSGIGSPSSLRSVTGDDAAGPE